MCLRSDFRTSPSGAANSSPAPSASTFGLAAVGFLVFWLAPAGMWQQELPRTNPAPKCCGAIQPQPRATDEETAQPEPPPKGTEAAHKLAKELLADLTPKVPAKVRAAAVKYVAQRPASATAAAAWD